jgi:hypothetical protein
MSQNLGQCHREESRHRVPKRVPDERVHRIPQNDRATHDRDTGMSRSDRVPDSTGSSAFADLSGADRPPGPRAAQHACFLVAAGEAKGAAQRTADSCSRDRHETCSPRYLPMNATSSPGGRPESWCSRRSARLSFRRGERCPSCEASTSPCPRARFYPSWEGPEWNTYGILNVREDFALRFSRDHGPRGPGLRARAQVVGRPPRRARGHARSQCQGERLGGGRRAEAHGPLQRGHR